MVCAIVGGALVIYCFDLASSVSGRVRVCVCVCVCVCTLLSKYQNITSNYRLVSLVPSAVDFLWVQVLLCSRARALF